MGILRVELNERSSQITKMSRALSVSNGSDTGPSVGLVLAVVLPVFAALVIISLLCRLCGNGSSGGTGATRPHGGRFHASHGGFHASGAAASAGASAGIIAASSAASTGAGGGGCGGGGGGGGVGGGC